MNALYFHPRSSFLEWMVRLAAKGGLFLGITRTLLADPLDHWTWRNPLPQGYDLMAAAYGGGAFVAVSGANPGGIICSTNGVTWSLASSAAQAALYGIAYGNDRFVAVGPMGTVVTSGGGAIWDSVDSGTQNALFGVTYGAGQFVAVGGGGTALGSTNGTNWVLRAPATAETLLDVCYGDGEFVAVGTRGAIVTSFDGVNWYSRNSSTSNDLVGVAFGGGRFIAVDPMKGLVSSTNGLDWRSYDVALQIGLNLNKIRYGGGKFVAVDGSGLVISSTNGLDWSLSNAGTGRWLRGVAWGDGLFVAVGDAGTISTSGDGSDWRVRSSGAYPQLNAIGYSKGAFVAVGEGGAILSSSDRVNWTARPSGTTNFLASIACSGGRFVVVGWNRTILSSDDGTIWVAHVPPPRAIEIPFDLGTVSYGAGLFVAVGSGLTGNVALWSTNGLDWSYGEIDGNGSAQAVAYGNSQFVAVCYRDSYGSFSYTSSDGAHWIQHDPIAFAQIHSIVYENGIFVAVGETGLVLTSSDGVNWTRQTSGIPNRVNLIGVGYGNGEFVAVSTGPLLVSLDGTNWTGHASSPEQLSSVGYAGNHFIGVGVKGRILESDPVQIPLQPTFDPLKYSPSGSFQFTLSGSSNQLYLVQASTNLVQWAPLLDVVSSNSIVQLEDPDATHFVTRFYRAIVP